MLQKILGVLLLVAGVLILVYHGFSVPKEHEGKLGPIEVRMTEHKRVDIPNWVGVASVIAGGGLLLWTARRK
jgi:uncharacterized membrane protein YdcZ (DUF606 family)